MQSITRQDAEKRIEEQYSQLEKIFGFKNNDRTEFYEDAKKQIKMRLLECLQSEYTII